MASGGGQETVGLLLGATKLSRAKCNRFLLPIQLAVADGCDPFRPFGRHIGALVAVRSRGDHEHEWPISHGSLRVARREHAESKALGRGESDDDTFFAVSLAKVLTPLDITLRRQSIIDGQ